MVGETVVGNGGELRGEEETPTTNTYNPPLVTLDERIPGIT